VEANFAIGPFVLQLELDQDVTEFNVEANFGSGPIDWQYMNANFAIGPILLAIRIRPGRH